MTHVETMVYLAASGQPIQTIPYSVEELVSAYRWMVQLRWLDEHAVRLQRTGRLGTYPSLRGQEALAVGLGLAMHPEDVFCPYYRDGGTLLVRGMRIEELLWYWGGDERGQNFSGPRQDLPLCVPIAGQCLHAVGVAWSFKIKGTSGVAVASIGDGGTSKGDFYEAINAMGVWDLPAVVVVNNNRWAISTPLSAQTKVDHLVHKALAAGIPGVQVDGNDVTAVWHATTSALSRARSGGGPTLIEALTWRACDHTTADDAKRYRSDEELVSHAQDDPISRLRAYLTAQKAWDDDEEAKCHAHVMSKIKAATQVYDQTPPQPVSSMWDHLYATLPDAYLEPYAALCQSTEHRPG